MSNAERDREFIELLETALRQPVASREQFLRDACGADSELFGELSNCLLWQERMGAFLLQPPALPALDDTPPFAPGEIVSGRFEIVREIGRGGMGVVYEAFDRKRSQSIAIKTARPGFRRLLTPELESALRIRHPNICLVNEIHTAQPASGEPVDFITMELLEGETLAARLARDGSVPTAEALAIARQLCSGIAAAHESGIVHRDLKPANIFLKRTNCCAVHAVITDFGLALDSSTTSEVFAGTPSYIAPELWNGQSPSQASDIYSLGIILYQIATGSLPGDKPQANSLSPRWSAAVVPCLHADPKRRPSAAAVAARLSRKRVPKALLVAAAMLPLLAFIPPVRNPVVRWWRPPPVQLAILPFASPADLGPYVSGALQGIVERLRTRRSGSAAIVVISPSEASANSVANASEAARKLHATHALQGRVSRRGSTISVETSLIDAQALTVLHHQVRDYPGGRLDTLPQSLAGSVSLALQLEGKPPSDRLAAAASEPYFRARYYLRRDGTSFDEAIPLLMQARAADERSPLPPAGLTEAWLSRFQSTGDKSALDTARQWHAVAESLNADSVSVRLAAGMLNEASGRYDQALSDYSRVLQLEPGNSDALYGLANVYDATDMPAKAVEAYRTAARSHPAYYAPYQNFGVYYFFHGQYEDAAAWFRKAIECAPGLLRAHTNLGAALLSAGHDDDAARAYARSLEIRPTASALNGLGAVCTYRGNDREAAPYFERALELEPRSAVALTNLADAFRRMGRAPESLAYYRRALTVIAADLETNPKRGYTRAFAGYLAARLGERERALSEIAQACQLSPSDQQVVRNAVLTYEALGLRGRALDIAQSASPAMLFELSRQPDLKGLRQDSHFLALNHSNEPSGSVGDGKDANHDPR